ncbi:hypothetical protein [Haloprofundus salinisoli]|nr:hypothetical protein [Haloprofundus salinisoli]
MTNLSPAETDIDPDGVGRFFGPLVALTASRRGHDGCGSRVSTLR